MKATPRTVGLINNNPKYLTPFKFKDYVFPDGFCLIVDSREQHSPLFLDKPPKGLMLMRDTLRSGDYGIRGFPAFAIEKKYCGDLFGYCSTEMDAKTYPKMERFRRMIAAGGWVGLVIEERYSDVFKWQEHTKVTPECVRGALKKFAVHYGVHVHFANNREGAARWILDMSLAYYEKMKSL